MFENICKFIDTPVSDVGIKVTRFVYETERDRPDDGILRSSYTLGIVTGGTVRYFSKDFSTTLKKGDIFLTFPGVQYRMEKSSDFRFMYVTFIGKEAKDLVKKVGFSENSPTFTGFDFLVDFWWGAILMMNAKNDDILAQSVLFYTLSVVGASDLPDNSEQKLSKNVISIKNYADTHFHEADISLSKVADVFGYNEKYVSTVFKSQMGQGFNEYLRNLRIERAKALFGMGICIISEVSSLCGYTDPAYFSKQFKAHTGFTPSKYISNLQKDKEK